MNITTIMKNPMTKIIGREEKRIGNQIKTYAKIIQHGIRKSILVSTKVIAPTSVNTNQNISYTIV